ncbi:putative RNA-directed DNA polymerase, partial [Tanacetum coccineum]
MSSQKKRSGIQIEAFKHRIVVDPKYAEKTWKVLEHAIHEIYNRNASGLSFEELYRVIHPENYGLLLNAGLCPSQLTDSREYTLKSQLLRLKMDPDETSSAYLLPARQYADALANIGEPFKEKDLVTLVVTGLRDEYDGFKSQIVAAAPSALTALAAISSLPPDTVNALQQVLSQLGLQVQPQSSFSQPSSQQPQAHYASRGHGRGSHNRGRGARSNSRNYNNNHSFNNSNG